MDAGYGSCVLREPNIAHLVQTALLHGDDVRYRLLAWVVMPNHVHALIRTLDEWTVGRIVGSWKSYTGRRINESRKKARLEPGGPRRASLVWHREYWDRFARNEAHVLHFRDYIHENPVKAGLVRRAKDWRWSSAHRLRPVECDTEQKSN
jgi:putative transposase